MGSYLHTLAGRSDINPASISPLAKTYQEKGNIDTLSTGFQNLQLPNGQIASCR
ncbi:MAG UNVERIFIED_CONTAM: hypothetical protein LVQ98_00420 [Rickettsiaceae bacterium]